MRFIKSIVNHFRGSYKCAIRDGMKVGRGVTVMGTSNFGSEPYLITLDDEVRISFGVSFITHDGGTWAFRDDPAYADIIKYGKIHVGKRSFIGCNTTIMPGVSIGEHCVIGAGSVVTKDIPDGYVAAGVPARILMTTAEYAEKCKVEMKPYDKNLYTKDKRRYLEEYLN